MSSKSEFIANYFRTTTNGTLAQANKLWKEQGEYKPQEGGRSNREEVYKLIENGATQEQVQKWIDGASENVRAKAKYIIRVWELAQAIRAQAIAETTTKLAKAA